MVMKRMTLECPCERKNVKREMVENKKNDGFLIPSLTSAAYNYFQQGNPMKSSNLFCLFCQLCKKAEEREREKKNLDGYIERVYRTYVDFMWTPSCSPICHKT